MIGREARGPDESLARLARSQPGTLYTCTKEEAGKQLWVHVANADLEQFVRSVGGSYAQLLQQLHHQPAEPFEGSWQSDLRVDLYEHILVGVHIKTLHENQCRRSMQRSKKGLQEVC